MLPWDSIVRNDKLRFRRRQLTLELCRAFSIFTGQSHSTRQWERGGASPIRTAHGRSEIEAKITVAHGQTCDDDSEKVWRRAVGGILFRSALRKGAERVVRQFRKVSRPLGTVILDKINDFVGA